MVTAGRVLWFLPELVVDAAARWGLLATLTTRPPTIHDDETES